MKNSEFSETLKKLTLSGVSMKEIAAELDIDNDALSKLKKGTLQSTRGKSISQLTEELYLHKKFGPTLSRTKIEIEKYDLLFLFYYWSHRDELKFGLLCLIPEKLNECKFYYFRKNQSNKFIERDVLEVTSLEHKNQSTIDIVVSRKGKEATFISAHLGSREINEITVAFCSYCGAMESIQKPYAGIGLLEKVEKGEFESKISSIEQSGFPSAIVNALYKRRFDISNKEVGIYESIEAIHVTQKEPLRLLRGQWIGYYLDRSIDNFGDNKEIVKFLLDVEDSGLSTMHFRESNTPDPNEYSILRGFFRFPIDHSGIIMLGEFQSIPYISKLVMYLKPYDRKLTGIFTGYRSIDYTYFSSPIVLEKIISPSDSTMSKEELIQGLLQDHNPMRYSQAEIKSNHQDIFNTLITTQKRSFDLIDTSI